jgi:hypothetical protein
MELLIIKSVSLIVGGFLGMIGAAAIYNSVMERIHLRRFMRRWNTTEGLCGWLIADQDAYHREIVRVEKINAELPTTVVNKEAWE